MIRSTKLEIAASLGVAELMAAAARTAPKTRGIDNIETFVVEDNETRSLIIKNMLKISKDESRPGFERDSGNIADSHAILLIGVRASPGGLNCGYCGHHSCEELKRAGGVCVFNSIDLGIAASSAAITASQLHIDNRIMYSIGKACIQLGMFSKEVKVALGIPLSVTGKNPFFDRK